MNTRVSKSIVFSVVVILAVIVIAVVFIVVKGTKSGSTLTAAQINASKQQIESNWKSFFAASTSLQDRENLLQDGSKFSQPIQTEFAALGSQSSSVSISSINLSGSSSANVVYSVDLNGHPVLTNQKGTALLIDNNWKVSDATLCQLLSLAGNKPAACQGN